MAIAPTWKIRRFALRLGSQLDGAIRKRANSGWLRPGMSQ